MVTEWCNGITKGGIRQSTILPVGIRKMASKDDYPAPPPPSEMQSRSAVCPPNEIHWKPGMPLPQPQPLNPSTPSHSFTASLMNPPPLQNKSFPSTKKRPVFHSAAFACRPCCWMAHHGRRRSEQGARPHQLAVVLKAKTAKKLSYKSVPPLARKGQGSMLERHQSLGSTTGFFFFFPTISFPGMTS